MLKMENSFQFSDDEIRQELADLGYRDILDENLQQFKTDLKKLIKHEQSKTCSENTSLLSTEASMVAHQKSLDDLYLLGREYQKEVQSDAYTLRPKTACFSHRDEESYTNPCENSRQRQQPSALRPLQIFMPPVQPGCCDDDTGSLSEFSDGRTSFSGKKFVKRKILRKNGDGKKFIDESVTESESGSILDQADHLEKMKEIMGLLSDSNSSSEPPYRLQPDDPRPPSVILRCVEHPHTRNVKKCDPVSRYHQFRQIWAANQVPGEKCHKNLRWNIREQMLQHDTFEKKPQKVYVPNNYVVPTNKQRKSLRWQVRMDMAQGLMPLAGDWDSLTTQIW